VKLITRVESGLRPPLRQSKGILKGPCTDHYNGPNLTVAGKLTWDHDKCIALWRGIQNYHMDHNGWSDIAYNFGVCPHGYTFEGRGMNIINAANGTNIGNKTSHGIFTFAGADNPFTDEEKIGFRETVAFLAAHAPCEDRAIPHSDWHPTACCGDARRAWVKAGMPLPSTSSSTPATPATSPTPAPPPPYDGFPKRKKPVIKNGDNGILVQYLQQVIFDKAGGNIKIDADFGDATEKRVKDVQRVFHLKVDGEVGKNTWGAIDFLALK
jgi:peptidoglycan hydrolase-like protein with peptidoglycan-binding domain